MFGNVNDGLELQALKLTFRHNGQLLEVDAVTLMKDVYGFLCMSKDCAKPILWERYAEGNCGVCFGLDVKTAALLEVEYVAECKTMELPEDWLPKTHRAMKGLDPKARRRNAGYREWDRKFGKVISTKLRTGFDQHGNLCNWEDEEECRSFINLDEKKNGHYFASFGRTVKLTEVILGSQCPIEIDEIKEILKDRRYVTVRRHAASAARENGIR
jgi:hypothetical protein